MPNEYTAIMEAILQCMYDEPLPSRVILKKLLPASAAAKLALQPVVFTRQGFPYDVSYDGLEEIIG